jgi:L-ascorbate metabolism protein UlaG (beta-lactamase superfamily)
MFEIEYKGGNGVVIAGKKATLIFDPKLSLVGLKDIKTKDAVVVATETRFVSGADDAKVLLDGPGEYEVADFTIRGTAATRHIDTPDQEKLATIYRVECSDVRIGVIGNIDPKLSESQYEALGVIDILIIPVGGGGYTLDATSAATIVRSAEPKVVIPVHYAEPGLSYEVPQDTLETFVKELGAQFEETQKLKVKSVSTLPQVLTVIKIDRS